MSFVRIKNKFSKYPFFRIKMGDLATEIEQMQQDINAFDDELDALEQ